jgi:hypothetical protein
MKLTICAGLESPLGFLLAALAPMAGAYLQHAKPDSNMQGTLRAATPIQCRELGVHESGGGGCVYAIMAALCLEGPLGRRLFPFPSVKQQVIRFFKMAKAALHGSCGFSLFVLLITFDSLELRRRIGAELHANLCQW